MPKSQNWCFTINNPKNNDIPRTWKQVQYCIWQLESGENGTPHLQGYVVFTVRKALKTVSNIIQNAHLEPRLGTHTQAKTYCQKTDTRTSGPWEIGDDSKIPETQGSRSDLMTVKKAIDEGQSDIYLLDNHFETCAKHLRFFREYKRIKSAPRNFKTKVIALWGPTNTGKSRYCSEKYPNAYWKPYGEWWSDYDLHETVIIDDFYGWMPYAFMLHLLDRYPLVVNTKFGGVNFVAKTIIITSNKHPQEWYNPGKCATAPLMRRFDEIIEYPLTDSPVASTSAPPSPPKSTKRPRIDLTCDEEMPDTPLAPNEKGKEKTGWTSSDEENPKYPPPPPKCRTRLISHLDHGYQSPPAWSPPHTPTRQHTISYTRDQIQHLGELIDEESNDVPFNLFFNKK